MTEPPRADGPPHRVWHGAELRNLLGAAESAALVATYFDRSLGPHAGYTGAWYDRFDSDPPSPPDRVTAHDLLAVQTLGVDIPAAAVLRLLDSELGDTLAGLLAQIPVGLDLAAEDAQHQIAAGSPAVRAWRLLRDDARIGRVRTAKLLARKRPRLLPVWDSVVECALGWNVLDFWTALRDELRADGGALHRQLSAAVAGPGVPDGLSPLRFFDVAFWMRHHGPHLPHGCPGMPD